MKFRVHAVLFCSTLVEVEVLEDGVTKVTPLVSKFVMDTPCSILPCEVSTPVPEAEGARFLSVVACKTLAEKAVDVLAKAIEDDAQEVSRADAHQLFGGNGEGPASA